METKTRLLNVKDIAEILNVKPKTLYQWAESGTIPCLKLNGTLRFERTAIEEWLKTCQKPSDSGYNKSTQARGPRKGGWF